MKHVLVVEDSPMVMKVIKHVLSKSTQFFPHYAMSFAEAEKLMEEHGSNLFAAMVDLNLPDAPNGEVVDFVLSRKVPTIVLTGSFDETRREKLLAKGIVDYVIKEGKFSYIYALNVLSRLDKNRNKKVLVVDDSSTARKFVRGLLEMHLFEVFEAEDGVEAIKFIIENPDICLMITDFNMPKMDGCELVKHIRVKYEKTDLAIIGLSSEQDGTLSARFIKNGANDFLRKPFNHEEFYCRISHNLELLESIDKIKDAVSRDDLTGLYSRRYFFEKGSKLFDDAKANSKVLSAAIIDIDDFASINEVLGHRSGDRVLCDVSEKLNAAFSRFLVARSSGNTFFALMPGLDEDKASEFINKIRHIICSENYGGEQMDLTITYSAGVSSNTSETLDAMLTKCMNNLKRAKNAGGDLVFLDD